MLRQKFTVQVTTLPDCDDITRFDGTMQRNWRRFCTLHTVPAVRQVVFADVQITIRQRAAVLPVLGYWSELCSYWLTENRGCL